MLRRSIATLAFVSICLVGCGEDSVGKVGNKEITQDHFNAYLQLKNIPADNAEKVDLTLERYLERAALASAIESTDTLDADMVAVEQEEFKKQMLIGRYFEQYLKDAVSEEAIRNYYSNHSDKYQSQKVHVAHILLRVGPEMEESERQVVLTTAQEAYSKLQAGEEFSDIAKAYSQDKVSAVKGGDLGWINQGAVAPRFSELAFSMQPDDVSEPFLTAFGFHIIKVVEAPQTVKKPLEAVKGDIRYQLRAEARDAEVKRLLGTISYDKE